MLAFLDRHQDLTYALLRMVTGFLFLWHGTQKLFGFPLATREGVPAFVTWGAGSIELVGGLLVMIGF
ncbi:MAG: DoxX family protein, partial [Pseudomonadales bacterium]